MAQEAHIFSPADFLGDWRHGSLDLWHSLEGPTQEGGVLLLGMWEMFRRVPAPCVAHPFVLKFGSGLACQLCWGCGEIDDRKARLMGDELHHSHVPEEAPPPINVIVLVGHGIGAIPISPVAPPPPPPPRPQIPPPPPAPPLLQRPPLFYLAASALTAKAAADAAVADAAAVDAMTTGLTSR